MIRDKVVSPILALLTQGITPEKISLSIALGFVLGIFPVLGLTTLLCALAAGLLRLNLPAIQLVNYLAYPIQLALIVPFIRIGEWFFRADPLPLSLTAMLSMVRADVWNALGALWTSGLHAISAWAFLGPLAGFLLYLTLLPLLRRFAGSRLAARASNPGGEA